MKNLNFLLLQKKTDIKKIVAIVENLITKINKNNKYIKMTSQALIDLQESRKELINEIKITIKKSKENVFLNHKNTDDDYYGLRGKNEQS